MQITVDVPSHSRISLYYYYYYYGCSSARQFRVHRYIYIYINHMVAGRRWWWWWQRVIVELNKKIALNKCVCCAFQHSICFGYGHVLSFVCSSHADANATRANPEWQRHNLGQRRAAGLQWHCAIVAHWTSIIIVVYILVRCVCVLFVRLFFSLFLYYYSSASALYFLFFIHSYCWLLKLTILPSYPASYL